MSPRGSDPDGGHGERTLLVVGDTVHHLDARGRFCTYTALARQLDAWFAEFDEVVIAAVLDTGDLPAGFSPYQCEHVTFVPLRQAGGSGIRAKVGALGASLSWVRALVPLLRRAEIVHLRTPCNITVLAIPLARWLSPRRYAIYAGAWDPPPGGPASYRLQRWMLRHFGGVVHVYAPASSTLAPNLRPNFSPTFTTEALDDLAPATARRLARIRSHPPSEEPLRICCVGRFSTNKNQMAVVRAAAHLRDAAIPFELRFAGSGGNEAEVRSLVTAFDLEAQVHFLGRCDESALVDLYEWADVNVMPSFVEGFGRVIVEGMALGCPAVCGPGTMQRAMIGNGKRGRQVDPADPADLATALRTLRDQSGEEWGAMARACRDYAAATTVEAFATQARMIVRELRR